MIAVISQSIAKLGIFIRCVLQNFDIFEHFVSLVPIQSKSTGKNILKSFVTMQQLCMIVTFFKTRRILGIQVT